MGASGKMKVQVRLELDQGCPNSDLTWWKISKWLMNKLVSLQFQVQVKIVEIYLKSLSDEGKKTHILVLLTLGPKSTPYQ